MTVSKTVGPGSNPCGCANGRVKRNWYRPSLLNLAFTIYYTIYNKNIMGKYKKEVLVKLVKESTSFSDMVRKISKKEKVHGGACSYLKKKVDEFHLDYSHFTGRAWNKGLKGTAPNKMTLENLNSNYLTTNAIKQTNNTNLKRWLFEFNLLEEKCIKCGNMGVWLDEPITLQLDHINGINNDHRIENLRILCPNCHSQTSTYAGKNNRE